MEGQPELHEFVPHPSFPHGLTDDDLSRAVAALSSAVAATHSVGSTGKMDLYLSYLQAALQEQSRRLSDEALRSSRRATRLSLLIAFVALVVAIFGTVTNADKDFEHKQTKILTEIRDELQQNR